jgi:hypothetical protein
MTTPNTGMPEIAQSQSSKEITHNQALRILDVLVPFAIVQDKDLTTPPAHVAGNMYIVATGATGLWSGQASKLAYSDGAAWYFIAPKNKWPAYVVDEAKQYRYNGTIWSADAPGDVAGAASSTDNAWTRFDGATGKIIQNGTWIEADTGDVTAGGALNMVDKTLQRPVMKDYAEEPFSLGNIAGTVDIDFEKGNFQYGTLIGNVTFTVSNPPATGKVGSMTLELNQDGTGNRTVTFPTSFKFAGGTAPTLSVSANAKDILVFFTRNAGITYNVGTFGLNFV